jgi:hypothetical protein
MVDPSELDKARNAIDHIGVAALPFLVKWIHYERPTWRFIVGYLLSRVPLAGAYRLSQRIIETQRYQLAEGTPYAFKLLGKEATPAFDDLCRLMSDTNGTEGSVRAPRALVCFGTNALPQLLAVATNELHPNRPNALEAIGEMSDIGDAAQIAITALTNCLNPTNDPFLQMTAISALGNLKTSPQSSVPALVSCLKSTTPQLRWYSTMALGKFGPQAISAIPALTKPLQIPTPTFAKAPPRRFIRSIQQRLQIRPPSSPLFDPLSPAKNPCLFVFIRG